MFWPHTKTLDVSEKHRKSIIANRKIFIFAQDNFLRLGITSFLYYSAKQRFAAKYELKAQYEPLIEIQKKS